jgi:hypothetical protein
VVYFRPFLLTCASVTLFIGNDKTEFDENDPVDHFYASARVLTPFSIHLDAYSDGNLLARSKRLVNNLP